MVFEDRVTRLGLLGECATRSYRDGEGDGEAVGRTVCDGATDGVGLSVDAGAVSAVVAWSPMSVASSLMRETTA